MQNEKNRLNMEKLSIKNKKNAAESKVIAIRVTLKRFIVFYMCVLIAASLRDLFRRGRRSGAGDASSSAGGVHDPHVAQ